MKKKDIASLTLEERIEKIPDPVTQATFVRDYYELCFDEYLIRFPLETYIEKGHERYKLGTTKGNYIFSCLPGIYTKKCTKFEDHVEVTMGNGVKIICGAILEPSSDDIYETIPGTTIKIE